MFRSAIFKLSAVFVGFVMVISISFSAVLYRLAVDELRTGFQNQYVRWLTEYRPYGLRQPGNPAAELVARSHHIQAQLLYFNVLVLFASAIASYLLAKRTLRPIERAHNQQTRFTADVSHELRTPLTALKMDTEVTLLDPKASKDDLRKTLQGNLDEVNRMETLINNLLQLSSLEANQLRNEFSEISIKKVAEDALGVVARFAATKKIILEPTLHEGFVSGDQPSLTQLAVILLENAVKYSPSGSTVRFVTASKGLNATMLIEDSGPGIPVDALPHVFDRFYRADKSRGNQSTTGFGLGLSLAKLIADLHGGEIIMTSTQGKGTQALIRLPAITPKPPRRPVRSKIRTKKP